MKLIDTQKVVTDMHTLAGLLRLCYVDTHGKLNLYKGTLEQMSIVAGYFYTPTDPVRRGKWIVKWWDDDGDARDWACSVCGFSHVYFDDMPTNYCPNCGAKMDLDTTGE